ncbi:PREDICTED: integrin alpha-4-like, partial [Hipposideros armiger]|uniref:Integrin alpha-4-like n=1 Tax=Hipposideros armiger TaxID=186990 RepID=A0A8B7QBC7_HIPAR
MAGEERRGPGPRSAAVREAVMLLLWLGVPTGRPYNVDTESALLYQGPPDTLFGYSVVLHSHGANRWRQKGNTATTGAPEVCSGNELILGWPCLGLVVGAPTANWLSNASVVNPGAIYRCRIGKNPNRTCEQLQL